MELKISKLDAARRELETAIVLFFAEKDPVSMHVLAASGHDILQDINKRAGGKQFGWEWLLACVRPESRGMFRKKAREAQNFFKHGDRDPDKLLDFAPDLTEYWIYSSCAQYREMTGEKPPLFWAFEGWYMLHHPEFFDMPADLKAALDKARQSLASSNRAEYFASILPHLTSLPPT